MDQYTTNILIIILLIGFGVMIIPAPLLCGDKSTELDPDAELRYFMLYKDRYIQQSSLLSDKSTSVPKRKIPAIGILLSAAVPGTGEMYAGSYIKGAVFLGLEVFLWWKYAGFREKGFNIEDKYETFADAHWDKERWEKDYNPNIDPSTHTLPDTRTQQYYEMIGKYDQFQAGWDDYENRDKYMTMRLNSNNEFEKASTCAMLTLANHVFSALDAAWTIRGVNRKVESQIRMSYRKVHGCDVPFVSLRARW
ncbi:MAG: hypothetical protein R6V04_13850 [bacterium]